MARLVFGMNQSLDGYVDHDRFGPAPDLFDHFVEQVRGQAGCLYGRRLYDIMRYWDDDRPEWSAAERDFARAWRRLTKWVVSRSLEAVGPNAVLVRDDLATAVRRLRDEVEGEIGVGGPDLAHSLGQLGLIDEYRIYLHPVTTGGGKRFFTGAPPPLRLVGSERIGDVLRLSYAPGDQAAA